MDQPFEGKGSSRFEDFGKKVDERFSQAIPRVEDEVRKVRQGSSQALRGAAETLRKLAEQLDDRPGSGAR
jgi:hypothetical protein